MVNATLGCINLAKRTGTLFIGAWVGHRAGLDGASHLAPPGFDLGHSSPQRVAVPTEISRRASYI